MVTKSYATSKKIFLNMAETVHTSRCVCQEKVEDGRVYVMGATSCHQPEVRYAALGPPAVLEL